MWLTDVEYVKMKYVRLFVLLLTLGLMTGCETMTKIGAKALGAASDDGISLDAQIGDKHTEVQTDVGSTKATGNIAAKDNAKVQVRNEKTDARVDQANVVKVQNIPPWVFLLALLGWILPTPQTVVQFLINLFKRNKTNVKS